MDRPLAAQRTDYSSDSRRGRGGGFGRRGGGGYRGGGGGRGPWNRGGGRGGGGGAYHPYGSRSDRGHGGRGSGFGGPPTTRQHTGNRFQAESPQDPKQAALQQLFTLLTKVGEYQPLSTTTTTPIERNTTTDTMVEEHDIDTTDSNANQTATATTNLTRSRPVVAEQAHKIQALTTFLGGSKAELFMQPTIATSSGTATSSHHEPVEEWVGPLVTGIVHCQSVFPLQSPCYAALTLAVQEFTRDKYPGLGQRCVEYAMLTLARDLDRLLLEPTSCTTTTTTSTATTTTAATTTIPIPTLSHLREDRPRAMVRARLTLRYLIVLARTGMIQVQDHSDHHRHQNHPSNQGTVDGEFSLLSDQPLSLMGLLLTLVQAAQHEPSTSSSTAAIILSTIVWSTIPYLLPLFSKEWIQNHLITPLQDRSLQHEQYQSSFEPGVGNKAILLKAERDEEGDDMGDDDDEDDDDDDNEDAESTPVCDTFQDLRRAVNQLIDQNNTKSSNFLLFTDAPWLDLKPPKPTNNEPNGEIAFDEQVVIGPSLVCTNEPLLLPFLSRSRALTLLLGGKVAPDAHLSTFNLDGIVFGRLPIFGPPPETQGEEDDEEVDGEEDDPRPKSTNQQLLAYQTKFGLVDRIFLAEAVRDCLLCHESHVLDTGLEHGGVRAVAEQIWSLRCLMEDSIGMEYCILEALFSLIVQCQRGSPLRLMYLCRTVLELTRLEPASFSPAIALGVSALMQDYLPALVPSANRNLSIWFALHLTNTDYQWPAAYWKHWESFVAYGWGNSRGAFCKGALSHMIDNLSNPDILVMDCLPSGSPIVDHLLARSVSNDDEDDADASLTSFIEDMTRRIYVEGESTDPNLTYLMGDEIGETLDGYPWARTKVMWNALLSPAKHLHEEMIKAFDMAKAAMEPMDDDEGKIDVLAVISGKIIEHKTAIQMVMEKDKETLISKIGAESNGPRGELRLLELVSQGTSFCRSLLEGCLQCCVQHELVQVDSVLKWCLGEVSNGAQNQVVLRWWELAWLSIQYGMDQVIDSQSKQMSIEDQAEAEPIYLQLLEYVVPLFTFMVQRICALLPEFDSVKRRKLTSPQIDLIEGFKFISVECQNEYFSRLMDVREANGSNTWTLESLRSVWSDSSLSGANLAMLVESDGAFSLDSFRQSLERLC